MNLVKILSTGNFSSRRDLARFPARLWSPGISLPAEILGKILAAGNFASRRDSRQDSQRDFGRREFSFPPRIPPRFPARFWPPGILFPARNENPAGQNLAGIPARFPAGSRQDPCPFFTREQLFSELLSEPDDHTMRTNHFCAASLSTV